MLHRPLRLATRWGLARHAETAMLADSPLLTKDFTVYAIIEDSGTQIKVAKGDVVQIDLRELASGGKELTFDRVLAVNTGGKATIGAPYVKGASVVATVLGEEKGDKTIAVKYSRRKGYRKKIGHRQGYLSVRIEDIKA